MKQNNRWVLVANASSARIFHLENMQKLVELKAFVHPESRMHEKDLVSSTPGRDSASVGIRKHALEPKTSQKDQEFTLFAKSISDHLEQALKHNEFSELYIAAAPTFLGILRQNLHQSIQHMIKKEINKDLVHSSTREILDQIAQ